MAAEYKITLVDGGGSGAGGGSGGSGGGPTKPPAWARDPDTNKALTPEYIGSYDYRAKEAKKGGFLNQLGFGIGEAFSGGPTSAMQKQFALMGMGGAGQALGSVAGASAAFGPVGAVIAGVQQAFDLAKAAVHKFTETVHYFIDRGKELEKFSGPIAGARARADVRSTLADIREAKQLGEGIAGLTDAQSRLEETVRQLLEPIKRFVVENLADLLSTIADIAQDLGPFLKVNLEILVGFLQVLVDVATGRFSKAMEDAQKMRERILKALTKEDQSGENILDEFFGGFGVDVPVDPQRAEAQQRMNSPGFAGT